MRTSGPLVEAARVSLLVPERLDRVEVGGADGAQSERPDDKLEPDVPVPRADFGSGLAASGLYDYADRQSAPAMSPATERSSSRSGQ